MEKTAVGQGKEPVLHKTVAASCCGVTVSHWSSHFLPIIMGKWLCKAQNRIVSQPSCKDGTWEHSQAQFSPSLPGDGPSSGGLWRFGGGVVCATKYLVAPYMWPFSLLPPFMGCSSVPQMPAAKACVPPAFPKTLSRKSSS